jgi:RNA polymerase sigma-70 factor (ECF subfamily)
MSADSPQQTVDDGGDRILVQRMLRGDEAACEEFFEAHFSSLYRFALSKVREAELARDLAQAAFCHAVRQLASFRGESSLTGWLFTICRNEIHGHFRRLGRRPQEVELEEGQVAVEEAGERLGSWAAIPDEVLEKKEVRQQVHETLDQLPPRYGQILQWKYLEGISVKEIAARLRLGPKAAESLLTRARSAFRQDFVGLAGGGRRVKQSA